MVRLLVRMIMIGSLIVLVCAAQSSGGAPPTPDSDLYKSSFAALTKLFVVAVVLESAFALIFSWRVFLTYFSLTGVKTIVMFAVSLLVVWNFNLDVFAELVAAYQKGSPPSSLISKIITAMVLAGGSSGINNIMVALGFRNEKQPPQSVKPPADKAWVAILNRGNSKGDVFVSIKDLGPAAGNADAPAPIAGMIGVRAPSLKELLVRNANRFPQNGGYTVVPGQIYQISVEAKNTNGDGDRPKALADEKFVFAPGAIVNFEVAL